MISGKQRRLIQRLASERKHTHDDAILVRNVTYLHPLQASRLIERLLRGERA